MLVQRPITTALATVSIALVALMPMSQAAATKISSRLTGYCSVGMADAPGHMRTMWNMGDVTATCDAAKTWLGVQAVDYIASGTFDPTADQQAELRCYANNAVLRKNFTGHGAEALALAAYAQETQSFPCVVHLANDEIQLGEHAITTMAPAVGHVSLGDARILQSITDLLNNPNVDPSQVEKPSFGFDADTNTATVTIPSDQQYLVYVPKQDQTPPNPVLGTTPDRSVKVFNFSSQSVNSGTGSSVTNGASLGLTDAPTNPAPSAGSSSGATSDSNAATKADEDLYAAQQHYSIAPVHYQLGDSQFGVGMETAADVNNSGDGYFWAVIYAIVQNDVIDIISGRLDSKRTVAAGNSPDALTVAPSVEMLDKTIFATDALTVALGVRHDIPEQVLLEQTFWQHPFYFSAGPVPMELKVSIVGDIGIKADYLFLGLKSSDNEEALVYHAGIKPYGAVKGVGVLAPLTHELPAEVKLSDVSLTSTITIISDTMVAAIDGDSTMSGPCYDVELEKPQALGVTIGVDVELHFGSTEAAAQAFKKAVDDVCGSDALGLVGPVRRLTHAPWGGVVGGLVGDVEDGASHAGGVLSDYAHDPSKIGEDIAKGCKGMAQAAVDANKLATFKYHYDFYKQPERSFGSHQTLAANKSCKQPVPPTTLELCNQHPARSIDVAVAKYEIPHKSWTFAGWTRLPPATCSVVSNFGVYHGDVYVYAKTDDGMEWRGSDASLCANMNGSFVLEHADSDACAMPGYARAQTAKVALKQGSNQMNFTANLPTKTLCNQSDYDHLFAAVGYTRGQTKAASGWIDLPQGQCEESLTKSDGPIYAYATTDTTLFSTEWSGSQPGDAFCAQSGQFQDLPTVAAACPSGGTLRSFRPMTFDTWNYE